LQDLVNDKTMPKQFPGIRRTQGSAKLQGLPLSTQCAEVLVFFCG